MSADTPDSGKCLCQVYKSPREEELYLFVDRRDGLDRVPAALLERFGTPQLVTTLVLTPERRLARAEASRVLDGLREQGYYLQMPPPRDQRIDTGMAELGDKNEKLPR